MKEKKVCICKYAGVEANPFDCRAAMVTLSHCKFRFNTQVNVTTYSMYKEATDCN